MIKLYFPYIIYLRCVHYWLKLSGDLFSWNFENSSILIFDFHISVEKDYYECHKNPFFYEKKKPYSNIKKSQDINILKSSKKTHIRFNVQAVYSYHFYDTHNWALEH